jgi:hypothetical protein
LAEEKSVNIPEFGIRLMNQKNRNPAMTGFLFFWLLRKAAANG